MKKNVLLYILLIFLVIVNGFFLFNYGTASKKTNQGEPNRPFNFITKELKFDDVQQQKMEILSKAHHQKMRATSNAIKKLKDALFNSLSQPDVKENYIDSITTLIGNNEKEKDLEIFHHFKDIQNICNDKQKKKFKRIISDALHRAGGRGQRSLHERGDNNGAPPPKH